MVKAQKPNPKSFKKDVPGKIKKTQVKKSKVSSTKEDVQRVIKTLENVGKKKFPKDIKQKNADVKKIPVQENLKKVSPKKKPVVAQVQEKSKKALQKKKPSAVVVQKNVKQFQKKNPDGVTKKIQKENIINVEEQQNVTKIQKKNPMVPAGLNKNKKSDGVVKKIKKENIKKVEVQKNIKKIQKKIPMVLTELIKSQKTDGVIKKTEKKIQKQKIKKIQKKNPVVKTGLIKNQTSDGDVKKTEKKMKQNIKEEAKKITSPLYVPSDFDEEKFSKVVCADNIKKICNALKILVEKEVSKKKASIFSDYKYILNVACYKIPNCPKRIVKLNVKHSLVDTTNDDVVLIVPDLQRGSKVEYEPTIQHYIDILREIGQDNIKVVPFNQLRNECSSFEAKRKFANTYDYFLCDGRIIGQVIGFCGKPFQKPRTTIHAVRLNRPTKYKSDIEHALKRTSYRQLSKGDLFSIPVGNHLFTVDQLADNIEIVVKQLKTIFPGGYANIRRMHIKIDIVGTSSLPLYVSLAGGPAEVPNVIGPREQRMLKLKKQANEILANFNMSKTGEFVKLNKTQVKRKRDIREARTALLSKESNEVEDEAEDDDEKSESINGDIEDIENGGSSDQENDSDISDED